MQRSRLPLLVLVVVLVACAGAGGATSGGDPRDRAASRERDPAAATVPERPVLPPAPDDADTVGDDPHADGAVPADRDEPLAADDPGAARPTWLGDRELPVRADGYGEMGPTPPELTDRRLPPPTSQPGHDGAFTASIDPVPDELAERSTWEPGCPVGLDELRLVEVAFWGFDEQTYRGELLVHRDSAEALVGVFARLFEARFPIEEMRVVEADELEAPPTGDGNNTTGFVCRPSVGSSSWSQHAYGRAVDLNPFHNPYLRDDVVLPELSSAYLDRDDHRPGMIRDGDVVTEAFADIGWAWGGHWSSSLDWMHFSANGR